MRFEQALKAMRRGEKVRRKSWPKGQYIIGEGEYVKKGEVEWDLTMALLATDWVIVRKKKPELRDVFKNPKVGDVIVTKDGSREWVVVGVDDNTVSQLDVRGKLVFTESRDWFSRGGELTVLHRAP